jgi:predicted ATP-dependent endonuclease of OLD family
MSEAFFADVVVLVEGEGDRAAILGAALARSQDFESMGIAVIPCGGKASMDRPALIFKGLGIPTYLVWDGDKDDAKGIRSNRILQRIVGCDPVDYPSRIEETFTCFQTKLETMLREELGSNYEKGFDNCMHEFGYKDRGQAEKNPRVLAEVIGRAAASQRTSSSLNAIVDHVLELHRKATAGH